MATNAQETANQENGSRVFFESVIEKGVEPSDKDMMKIYNNYINDMDFSPVAAFEAAERDLYILDYFKK